MAIKGYLPPDGRQNIHNVPYTYREEQAAHKIGTTVVESPEPVILTADEYAQKRIEQYALESLPEDVATEALEATRVDDTERVADIVDEYRGGESDETVEETDDVATILSGTLGDLDDALASGNWDTHDKLSELYEYEEDHKDREGAYQRLEEHRQTIDEDDE